MRKHNSESLLPRFSVVIPLYNKGRHVAKALNSVLSQHIPDFEVIVVDDGSTDNGAQVVQSFFDSRIKLLRQANAGVSAARNRGIEEAEAELIAFLDADDAWEPDFLGTIAALTEKFPKAGAFATAYVVREPDGKMRTPRYEAIPRSSQEVIIPSYFLAGTLGEMPVWASAVCIPKAVFREVGVFSVGEKLGEDHDMWARIALQYPIAFSWSTGAIYFQDSDNRACVNFTPQEDIIFIRRLQEKLDNNEVLPALIDDVKKFVAIQLIHIAAMNVKAANRDVAKRVLADGRTKIFQRKRFWWSFWAYVPYKVMASAWGIKKYINNL